MGIAHGSRFSLGFAHEQRGIEDPPAPLQNVPWRGDIWQNVPWGGDIWQRGHLEPPTSHRRTRPSPSSLRRNAGRPHLSSRGLLCPCSCCYNLCSGPMRAERCVTTSEMIGYLFIYLFIVSEYFYCASRIVLVHVFYCVPPVVRRPCAADLNVAVVLSTLAEAHPLKLKAAAILKRCPADFRQRTNARQVTRALQSLQRGQRVIKVEGTKRWGLGPEHSHGACSQAPVGRHAHVLTEPPRRCRHRRHAAPSRVASGPPGRPHHQPLHLQAGRHHRPRAACGGGCRALPSRRRARGGDRDQVLGVEREAVRTPCRGRVPPPRVLSEVDAASQAARAVPRPRPHHGRALRAQDEHARASGEVLP